MKSLKREHIARLFGIIAMLIWAGVLLGFYATGEVKSFIRPEYLRICSLLAGLGLGVLAVFNLMNLKKETDCCHDHDHDHGDGDEHEHDHEDTSITGNAAMFLVMVIPMLAAAAFSEGGYQSAQTIRNKGFVDDPNAVKARVEDDFQAPNAEDGAGEDWEYTLEDLEKVVDRSDAGNLLLTVDQLFYTTGDQEIQKVLEGQPVETVGQVLPEIGYNPGGKRVRVFTLMVTCCRADAQPVSIPLEFAGTAPVVNDEETAEFKEMSWIKVSGTMRYPIEDGRTQAVIEVKEMTPTEEPVNEIMF